MAGVSASVTPASFATSLLSAIGAPKTPANVSSLVGWQAREGGHWNNSARYNPLNTTQNAPGATSMNGVGVKAYTSWPQGLSATVATLNNGHYGDILSALHSGRGLSGDLQGLRTWSGGGYSSVPGSLGRPTVGGAPIQTGVHPARPVQVPEQTPRGITGIPPTEVPHAVTTTTQNPGVQELETLLGGSGLGGIGSLLSGALNSTQEHTQFITPQHSQTLDAQRSLQELAGPVQINLHPASGAGTVGTGGNKIAAMTKMANALVGKPYIWGGGHSAWGPQGGYDCSGFVSAVLHAAGYLRAPQTTQTLPSQPDIASGPGRYVTVYDRTDGGTPSNDHVIIDVNGAWYESGGSGNPSRNGGVARIPKPDPSYLSSFNRQLHPLGL